MQAPRALIEGIEAELSGVEPGQLARATAEITENYKQGNFAAALRTRAHRAAYLAVRMPATFAANLHVFREIRRVMPDTEIRSLLDLGAGPGTAVWAASQVFSLDTVTCIERDSAMIDAGRRLASWAEEQALQTVRWMNGDVSSARDMEKHDLVVISYALGELPSAQVDTLLRTAWMKAANALVVIEPGTPRGFANVHGARASMIDAGASIAAPCPHHETCPMYATGDWCHFAERLERSSLHRRLKSGSLGYEDEKFSYLVAARGEVQRPESRILRHPMKHSGHIQLTLCRPGAPELLTVARSQKELYPKARRAEWGDGWPMG